MTPEQRQKVLEREMRDEWQGWQPLIEEDLKRIDHRIQMCYSGMKTFSVPKEMRERFVIGELARMIQKVSEGA